MRFEGEENVKIATYAEVPDGAAEGDRTLDLSLTKDALRDCCTFLKHAIRPIFAQSSLRYESNRFAGNRYDMPQFAALVLPYCFRLTYICCHV